MVTIEILFVYLTRKNRFFEDLRIVFILLWIGRASTVLNGGVRESASKIASLDLFLAIHIFVQNSAIVEFLGVGCELGSMILCISIECKDVVDVRDKTLLECVGIEV